jgi:PAS domain-containing protein
MRDQHRDKRDLVNEITDLRKQVADLKHSATERRRVEDGLLRDRELFRALLDQAPHALCLLSAAGAPLLANQPFVELLGYASPGELVRLAGELGLVLGDPGLTPDQLQDVAFRRSDGGTFVTPTLSSRVPGTDYLAITILTNPQLA